MGPEECAGPDSLLLKLTACYAVLVLAIFSSFFTEKTPGTALARMRRAPPRGVAFSPQCVIPRGFLDAS